MRKQILDRESAASGGGGLDIPAIATAMVSSESPDHPVENAFDGRRGPGASRWVAALPGEQTLILAFDAPQAIARVALEIEEPDRSRAQELTLAASSDGGVRYRELIRQGFHFAPPGTTTEREEWTVNLDGVTHLRLTIDPDSGGGEARACITALGLY